MVDAHPHNAVAHVPPHRRHRPLVSRAIQGIPHRGRRSLAGCDALCGAESGAGKPVPRCRAVAVWQRLASHSKHRVGGSDPQAVADSQACIMARSRQSAPNGWRGGCDQEQRYARNALRHRRLGFTNRSPTGGQAHIATARSSGKRGRSSFFWRPRLSAGALSPSATRKMSCGPVVRLTA